MRVLVTGSEGFMGQHLTKTLTADGQEIFRFARKFGLDIRNYEQVRTALLEFWPDQVFHLAALSFTGESRTDPRRAMEINLGGTHNLLEAARALQLDTHIHLAGTSDEYGYVTRDGNLTEDSACYPANPYAVSKLASTTLGVVYARQYGLHVVATRAFHHIGYGSRPFSVLSTFARRIVKCERGLADHVIHGDLSPVRDFTHVHDVVRAYRLAVDCEPGIYNVCSGKPVSMQRLMDMLVTYARVPIILKQDSALGKADQCSFPLPSYAKLHDVTGWHPLVPLEQAMIDMLDYWRDQ